MARRAPVTKIASRDDAGFCEKDCPFSYGVLGTETAQSDNLTSGAGWRYPGVRFGEALAIHRHSAAGNLLRVGRTGICNSSATGTMQRVAR